MAVKMRLRREGKKKQPFYRVVVADVRSPRDGRFIEDIGYYQPTHDPSTIKIDHERALYWLRTGVQPSDAVRKLLRIEGIWEEYKPGDTGRDRSLKHQQRARRAEEQAATRAEAERAHREERETADAQRQAAAQAEADAAAAPAVDDAADGAGEDAADGAGEDAAPAAADGDGATAPPDEGAPAEGGETTT